MPATPEFRATLELGGKTATGIRVPAEAVEALGAGKQPKVRATVNGYTYRSSVASRGGEFLLPVSADVRGHAGVQAGDEVEVRLELDTAPREVDVPPDLAQALGTDQEAKRIFDKLSYSHQLRYVLWISDARRDETRQRRVAETLTRLKDG